MFVCNIGGLQRLGIQYLWSQWVLYILRFDIWGTVRLGPQVLCTQSRCTVCFTIRTLHGLPNIDLLGTNPYCFRPCSGFQGCHWRRSVHCACAGWTLDFVSAYTDGRLISTRASRQGHDSAADGCDGEAQGGAAEGRASMDLSVASLSMLSLSQPLPTATCAGFLGWPSGPVAPVETLGM